MTLSNCFYKCFVFSLKERSHTHIERKRTELFSKKNTFLKNKLKRLNNNNNNEKLLILIEKIKSVSSTYTERSIWVILVCRNENKMSATKFLLRSSATTKNNRIGQKNYKQKYSKNPTITIFRCKYLSQFFNCVFEWLAFILTYLNNDNLVYIYEK